MLTLFAALLLSVEFRIFVADADAGSLTIGWGRADGVKGNNTIGRDAKPGRAAAVLRMDGREFTGGGRTWVRVDGLKPDTEYPYSVTLDGAEAGRGSARTWPLQSRELTFFVIGDFGNGSAAQYKVAKRMEEERSRLAASNSPVRFVLSMGDNIYGKTKASGKDDRDWDAKYYAPYADTLRAVPFKAILGNHDGNESEKAEDTAVCLDNFFMPARWYRFAFADFVEFIALDSSKNQMSGPPAPLYSPGGEQSKWLAETLAAGKPLPWRLATMHNPMFSAGPRHGPILKETRHWFEAFRTGGVQAVFSGHEHNLQFSMRNTATGGMQFVVSGAGGQLRRAYPRKKMAERNIAAVASLHHFLAVSIRGDEMTIQPIGIEPIGLRDASGNSVTLPIRVQSAK